MARVVNLTTNEYQISDLLNNGLTQYQDGIKVWTLAASATATIPNLQACNSVALKALVTAGSITVDTTVEPSDIIGMDNV